MLFFGLRVLRLFPSAAQSLILMPERCIKNVIAVKAMQSVTKRMADRCLVLSLIPKFSRDLRFIFLFISRASAQ